MNPSLWRRKHGEAKAENVIDSRSDKSDQLQENVHAPNPDPVGEDLKTRQESSSAAVRKRSADLYVEDDRLADDLIRRVLVALDEWAVSNQLTYLPREMIYDQALAILRARQKLLQINADHINRT